MIINALHRNNASHRNNRMIIMLRKIKILFIYHLILPLKGAKFAKTHIDVKKAKPFAQLCKLCNVLFTAIQNTNRQSNSSKIYF